MKRHERVKVSRNDRAAKAPKNTPDPGIPTPEPAVVRPRDAVVRPRDVGQMRRRRESSPQATVRTAADRLAFLDPASITTVALKASLDTWLLECEGIQRMSPLTIKERRARAGKLVWFLETEKLLACDRNAITRFFAYLCIPLKPGEKRWGSNAPGAGKVVSAKTAKNYWMVFSAWFRWLIKDGQLPESPLAKLETPQAPQNSPQPFTLEQLEGLFDAARRSLYPNRDQAILALMLDTGIRTCELIGLSVEDVDMASGTIIVLGKGNKPRQVGFGVRCRMLLNRYLSQDERRPGDPLFVTARGESGRFTGIGLRNLYTRLGQRAGITGVRCSPHTMRHAFATLAIRTGRLSEFTLQNALGHTTLSTTLIYSRVARADVVGKMRAESPLDLVLGKPGRSRKE
ncbi:tyrosine-type recombinase/integrase [Armatimonas sp.]|uniref:tyrosine-type recombinase/integrase n=1 Tax=Armatimonas sp. TaxID=1872638 RepID=UPI003752D349